MRGTISSSLWTRNDPSPLSSQQQQYRSHPIIFAAPSPSSLSSSSPFVLESPAASTATIPVCADESALSFARQAPLAGFLNKCGTQVPVFKRRFFVLQPATHLYYFLTPHDTAPRGCLDLHGARVEAEWAEHNDDAGDDNDDDEEKKDGGNSRKPSSRDGVYRFALVWDETTSHDDNTHTSEDSHGINRSSSSSNSKRKSSATRRVILEARSRADAVQWMRALEEQRLSYSQAALRKAQLHNSAAHSRIAELERQAQNYKLVEQDRDGALQDAARWRRQFQELDESIRRLTQQLRPNTTETVSRGEEPQKPPPPNETSCDGGGGGDLMMEKTSLTATTTLDTASTMSNEEGNEEGAPNKNSNNNIESNSINDNVECDDDTAAALDIRNVPGTYFGALYNTVEQLRENLRLASEEASTAVEDVLAANERVEAVEMRMEKAEKHLCKLWEENCALRKNLKQKKREKRVLVREVKNLRNAAIAISKDIRQSLFNDDQRQSAEGGREGEDDNDNGVDDDDDEQDEEERLINDLEKHVQSSLRLHEEFLAANGEIQAKLGGRPPTSLNLDTSIEASGDETLRELLDSTMLLASETKKRQPSIHPNVPLFENSHNSQPPNLPVASLFDQSDDEDDDDSEALDAVATEAGSVAQSVVSLTGSETRDTESHYDRTTANESTSAGRNMMDESSVDESISAERPNPLLQLDADDDDEEGEESVQPHLYPASSQSESSSIPAPPRRQATSKLSCPFADVVQTASAAATNLHNSSDPTTSNYNGPDDLRPYHLTFYSRKIGIQFQKVPPPPAKPRGLLTDAITADLANISSAGEKTAAELRRIAAISTRGRSSSGKKKQEEKETSCDVATPVDAVLVCGFEGFDDSGNNERPKLGARLVAFDGVSIEVGKWTFASVRKAIQARNRPLTLSFRDDFLTTEQRTILTKAVKDMEMLANKTDGVAAGAGARAPPPLAPNKTVSSYGSGSVHSKDNNNDDQSSAVSVTTSNGSDYFRSMPESFSGPKSVASSSATATTFYNHRSFSEAGSSSSVLSAVAPLVSNLLSRNTSRGPFTPEYLQRTGEPVEDTPQHQDFKSELL